MRLAAPAAALVVCALLAGCAPQSTVRRLGPPHPPRPPGAPIAVYFGEDPGRPYVEIGRIHVRSNAHLDAVVAEAVDRARELGADALIIDLRYHDESLPVTFDAAGRPDVPSTPRLNARAAAIVFSAAASSGAPR